MGNETVSRHICLHRSTKGRLLAALFLVSSVAATITYVIGLWRNSAFVVSEGIVNNWGQVLLLVVCAYLLARIVCMAERVLFSSCALISILILAIANIPSLRGFPGNGVFWRVVLLILACVAAVSAGQIAVNRRRGSPE
jgi:hypothetical protein